MFFDENDENSIKQNWLNYFDDDWNSLGKIIVNQLNLNSFYYYFLDATGCFLFAVGVLLRIISIFTLNYNVFIWAK